MKMNRTIEMNMKKIMNMKIQSKLLLNSLGPLIIALFILLYIVLSMTNMQTSNNDLVGKMQTVQELKSKVILSQQALSNYSFISSQGNKADVITYFKEAEREVTALSGMSVLEKEQVHVDAINSKFANMGNEVNQAMDEENGREAKRLSIRLQGALNDIYEMDLLVKEQYKVASEDLKDKVSLTWIVATIGGILLLVIAGVSGIFITRRMAGPILRLNEDIREISLGNLSVHPQELEGKDEIAEMSRSFSQMVTYLRNIIQSIGSAGERIDTYAKEIHAENITLTEITNQISSATGDLASGSYVISTDLAEVVTNMEDLKAGFINNLIGSEQSSQFSKDAAVAVQDGQSAIAHQKETVEQNHMLMNNISRSVQELSESITEVFSLTGMVTGIANQTKILSLNASIEASRAGEAGRGFAVVSQEIRHLAEETSTAATHIFEIVNEINERMNNMVSLMTAATLMAEQQEDSMIVTSDAFKVIESKVGHIVKQLVDLTEEIRISQRKSNKVLNSVESISAVTEEATTGSEEIAAATVEQQQAFIASGEKVRNLLHIANELHEQIAYFRKG